MQCMSNEKEPSVLYNATQENLLQRFPRISLQIIEWFITGNLYEARFFRITKKTKRMTAVYKSLSDRVY